MAGVMLPVVPERRHIFIAQPAPGASWDDAAYAGRTPSSRLMVIDFDTTFYFHREGAGLLFGMGDRSERPGFDTTVRWDFLPEVTETAVRRLPALAEASVTPRLGRALRDDARPQPGDRRPRRRRASTPSPASAATASSTRRPPAGCWPT